MTSTASFHQKTFNLKKKVYFSWLVAIYCLKKALKSQNDSNFIEEQEVLSNRTIGCAQHQKKIKTDELGINESIS